MSSTCTCRQCREYEEEMEFRREWLEATMGQIECVWTNNVSPCNNYQAVNKAEGQEFIDALKETTMEQVELS